MALGTIRRVVERAISKLHVPGDYERAPKAALSAEQREAWDRNGYLVLPGHFSGRAIEELNALIETLWTERRERKSSVVIDIFIGTDRERRIKLHDAPDEARHLPYKMNDLYLEFELVRNVVLEERLAAILEELLGAPPLVCNTLDFEFGSQQDCHTDSLYMTPRTGLNLAATWIALEDCGADAGPLRYYPGSHKIPPYLFSHGKMTAIEAEMPGYDEYMSSQIAQLGLKDEVFCAARGDVFIWHSQLYHGGSLIQDPKKTRRSLVTHYFRAKDVPGIHGTLGPGRYYQRRDPQPVRS